MPAPELKFDDIKVADQEGSLDRPFLEARSLEAWLNIGALLSGTIEARKIAIVDPVLRLDVKADGTGNWSDVGRRGVALPFAPKDVMLDSVSVSGGRVEVTKQGVPQLTLEDVSGEANAQSLSGPYKVSANYQLRRPSAGAQILDQRARCRWAVPHQVLAARSRSQHHLSARWRRDRARRHAGL